MPAKAGIQLIGESLRDALDASLRWHDSDEWIRTSEQKITVTRHERGKFDGY